MNQIKRYLAYLMTAVILTAGLAVTQASAQQQQQQDASVNNASGERWEWAVDPLVFTPVVWSVIAAPLVPVKGTDGRIHLAYAMIFTNVSTAPARLESIEVVDPARNNRVVGTSRVVATDGKDVSTKFRQLGLTAPQLDITDYSDRLRAARAAYVYLDVTFNDVRDVPRQIKHRVTISREDAQGNQVNVTAIGGAAEVSRTDAAVLSPPLRGERWLNANGCGEIIGPHRYGFLPANGTIRPAEQFAIDFTQLDAQGRAFVGDFNNVESWRGYGSEVVSASAGRVVAAVGDLPNQVPGEPKQGITPETLAGNHVIVDMGGGRYVLYAHLIPGSVAVGVGDRVYRGQRLGLLGNSGNSDAPHLHFQVMNRASALDADGLPFVFDRLEFQGRIVGTLDDSLGVIFTGGSPLINFTGFGQRRREMPLTLDLVGFK